MSVSCEVKERSGEILVTWLASLVTRKITNMALGVPEVLLGYL